MGNKKIRVGIIGCGTIGAEIAKACLGRLNKNLELVAICDIDKNKASVLKSDLGADIKVLEIEDLVKAVDLVVEAASAKISADIVELCIKYRRDCLVMSVGGLIGREELLAEMEASGARIYIPSGAICGLDGLKSALAGRVDSVTLTTRKPPKGLAGAPYLKDNGVDLSGLTGEMVVFEGSAAEAVKGFPKNVNVAAVLSLAGLGARKTRVKIITAPDYKMNAHEVEITGEFGRLITKTENLPSKTNPKTSVLAIFSAIATLESIARGIKIGT